MRISSAILVSASFIASAHAHARLGTVIPGFGRIQGVAAGLNRHPVNSAEATWPMEFCKGYQKGKGKDQAKELAIGNNTFDLEQDIAPHGGGSMQVSLSFDEAKTFKVLKSWIGNYPRHKGGDGNAVDTNQTYLFVIPPGTQSGYAVLSWSWNNAIGNREWYQDCAPVTIPGDGKDKLDSRLDIFVANVPKFNNCTTKPFTAPDYPGVGQKNDTDVERDGNPFRSTVVAPDGDCGKKVVSEGGGPAPANSTAPPKLSGGNAGSKSYTVVSGDTCDGITGKTGVPFADLRTKNPSIDEKCSNIMPGQVLALRKRSRIMIFDELE